MPLPTPTELIAFFDANPARYKNNPLGDGYNPTDELNVELTKQEEIANPTPQGDVETPLTIADAQALISVESLGRLSDSWWDNMRIYLSEEGSRADAVAIVNNAESRGNITPTEGTDLRNALLSTISDPNWPATVLDDCDGIKQWNQGGFTYKFTNDALGRS